MMDPAAVKEKFVDESIQPVPHVPVKKDSARKRVGFDAVVLAVYLAAANPALTGIAVHEWLGLGAFVLLIAHCAIRGVWRGATGKALALTALNLAVLLVIAICVVSGIMVSGAVLPALGLYADGYYFWDPLHAVSAKVLLALLLVHVVVHWKWLVNVFRRKGHHAGGRDGGGPDGA